MRRALLLLTVGLVGLASCRRDVAAPALDPCDPANAKPATNTTLDTVPGGVVAHQEPAVACDQPLNAVPSPDTSDRTGTVLPGGEP